jgi:cytochrome c oxidase subunit 2
MFQKLLGLPINASAHGHEIDNLIGWVHLLMFVLFVGWGLLFLFILWRFRRKANPQANPVGVRSHASSYVEAGVAVLEVILLVGISIPFWAKKVSAFPTKDEAVHVRVVAQQFAWNIHYPGPDGVFGRVDMKLVSDANPLGLDRQDKAAKDDFFTVNQLYLPVNKPALLDLTTKDVIHSFFLPLFRVKQDTIPGMTIPIYFTPTMTTEEIRQGMKETIALTDKRNLELYSVLADVQAADGATLLRKNGRLTKATVKKLSEAGITSVEVAPANPTEIACAQLCGLNHYRMKGFVNILPPEKYDAWVAEEVENAQE